MRMSPAYEISTVKDRLDIGLIHKFLGSSYWATGRSRQIVERSIAHSLCFSVYQDGQQIGFARVVTDRVVFVYLMDVFRADGVSRSRCRKVIDARGPRPSGS